MSSRKEVELIIDDLYLAMEDNKTKASKYAKSQAKKIVKIPEEVATREQLIKDLENKIEELIENDDALCDVFREIYKMHNITLKNNSKQRLIENNYCISARKKMIDSILRKVREI